MFKRAVSLLLCVGIIITMGLCLCSCKGKGGNEYPVTIGDVTIDKEPLNIVVLSDCMSDIVSYMGYDVKMVGRNIESDQEFLSIVPIVGTAQSPNVDAIVSYETDLVIAEDTLTDATKTALAEANIPVVTFKRANSFEELKTLYTQIGTVLGGNVTGKAQGETSYDALLTTLSDFEDAIPNDVIKTACYLYFNDEGKLCTLTNGTIEHELFSYCGAINVFSSQETPEVDPELLKISTPSYVFYDDDKVLEYLKTDDTLSTMHALNSGQVLKISRTDLSRQGTTYEEIVYQMINYMFVPQATPDEATPDQTETQPDNTEETVVGFISD